ncbi:MFS transporter [Streptomyces capparidis]
MITFAFTTAMAFSTVPTPLYPLYAQRNGFGSLTVTVVFAVYAVGVLTSLFLAGHLSDQLGRRKVLVTALLVESAAAAVFVAWQALPALIAARLLTGLGVGMVTATATAHIGELNAAARPGAGRRRADLTSTAANIGGLSFGPLVAGALAQWAPAPLRTPYLVFAVLLLLAAAAAVPVPETVAPGRRPYRPQRVSVPSAVRGQYFAVSTAAAVVFAVFGMFTSLAPSFVAVTMHHPSRALAGLVAFSVFAAAATAQLTLAALRPSAQLRLGLAVTVAGLPLLVAAVWTPSLPLFLAGAVVAGAGGGVLFKGAVSTVVGLAPPATRGEALAGFFLGAYLGLTVPVLALGVATRYLSSRAALTWFIAALALAIAVTAPGIVRRRHVPPGRLPPPAPPSGGGRERSPGRRRCGTLAPWSRFPLSVY